MTITIYIGEIRGVDNDANILNLGQFRSAEEMSYLILLSMRVKDLARTMDVNEIDTDGTKWFVAKGKKYGETILGLTDFAPSHSIGCDGIDYSDKASWGSF